jgi:hypothetical protein
VFRNFYDLAPPKFKPIADCRLPIADCRLPIADCRLPIADCRLPIANKTQAPILNGCLPFYVSRLLTSPP